jgi:rhodanese-related sulfurtransferase
MAFDPAEGFARLGAQEVHAKLEAGWSPVWVDVRKPHEWEEGTLVPAQQFIPHEQVMAEGLPGVDKSTPVVLQCRSGGRSGRAAAVLVAMGYTDVTNLEGGYLEWSAAYGTK